MLCDKCKKQLTIGTLITKLDNFIEYMECQEHGIVEVMGMNVKEDT